MLVSSRRALGLALTLGLATRLSLLTHRSAALIALAATGLVLLERLVFPGGSKATEAQRRLLARFTLAATRGSSVYDLHEHLYLEPGGAACGVDKEQPVALRLKLTPALHNFFGSMHGGAIASAIDVATTVAIASAGGWPGVSTSLGVTYVAGCAPDEEVRLVPSVLKLGATLAYTECKLYRLSDGVLMARGWHVKHVVPPGLAPTLLLALRPALLSALLGWCRGESTRGGPSTRRAGPHGDRRAPVGRRRLAPPRGRFAATRRPAQAPAPLSGCGLRALIPLQATGQATRAPPRRQHAAPRRGRGGARGGGADRGGGRRRAWRGREGGGAGGGGGTRGQV